LKLNWAGSLVFGFTAVLRVIIEKGQSNCIHYNTESYEAVNPTVFNQSNSSNPALVFIVNLTDERCFGPFNHLIVYLEFIFMQHHFFIKF
jgi:hypothetical protein